jgi:hypothetical protein
MAMQLLQFPACMGGLLPALYRRHRLKCGFRVTPQGV